MVIDIVTIVLLSGEILEKILNFLRELNFRR